MSATGASAGANSQPDQTAAGPPRAGARVGQYELIRELGRGGMGAVFLARDTKLGRRAAIKFLHSEQPEVTARFILEARATARCNHENIVIIYEVGEHQGSPYMVLEYLQGSPLNKLLAKGRTLSVKRAVGIMVPVVRALACAHEHNIVHRDLKPDNIFVTDSGTVKVLDFGIAKLVHEQQKPEMVVSMAPGELDALEQSHRTRHGALIGTLPYMSPEQWGAGSVDHRTDIWAAGIILFRMITGQHPLGNARGAQFMVTGLLDEPMPAVHDRFPDVPDDLAYIIDRCLIKDKEQRIGSAAELLEALEPLLPGYHTRTLRIHERPFAGLSAFQEADANRFFGRADEIAAAVTRLRDQPLLGVVGPSGVGKSSFVRAGVVPALKQSGEPWTSIVIRPGRQPVAALAQVAASMIRRSSNTSAGDMTEHLAEHQALVERLHREPGWLGTVLRSRARRKKMNILLFVDQFEELYTLVDDVRERRAFTACLASVADDATTPLRVILSVRSDFLDRVPEDPHFVAELTRGLFFLTPPGRQGLRDALIQPAEMAGYQFESPAMVEDMLDHLEHTPGALPLLQFAASKLWDMRDQDQQRLTEASYRAIGGIAGALASHADAVVARFPAPSRALARALFLRLVTPERTRAVVSVSDLHELSRQPGEVEHLVAQLVDARLLVVHGGDRAGGNSVEIVHESLIERWPLLRRWLDENQDDAAFLEQLRTAAKQWDARGRPNGLLWRGEAMEEARRWQRRYRGQLPALQQAYLAAVLTLAARSTRRKRYVLGAVIVVLSLMVAAGAVALVLISDAQQQATEQARVAQNAEEAVREQLERVQAEVRARQQAEAELKATLAALQDAKGEVERAKDGLEDKNKELAYALKRAKRSRRRARKARQEALSSEAAARQSEAEARLAVEEMKSRLAQAKATMDALQIKVRNMIRDVPLDK